MSTLLGPLLQFLGVQNQCWCVSVLVVTDTATSPTLQSAAAADPFTLLCNLQSGAFVWRGTLAVTLAADAQRVCYSVEGQTNTLYVPADGESPRMAYGSCNGFSSPSLMKGVDEKRLVEAADEFACGARAHQ